MALDKVFAECPTKSTRQRGCCRCTVRRAFFAECDTRQSLCRVYNSLCRVSEIHGKGADSGSGDFLIANGFKVGKADPTLFTKTLENDLFVCQIYVDDIIFGSTNESTCEEFSRIMTQKFEMSMMGELKYFLGFQVRQLQ